MRTYSLGLLAALWVAACSGGNNSDAGTDSAAPVDVASDTATQPDAPAPHDSGTPMCSFDPAGALQFCAVQSQRCVAPDITCAGGVVLHPTCTCMPGRMMQLFWMCTDVACDNGDAGADAGSTDAAASDAGDAAAD